MPYKGALEVWYLDHRSLWTDAKIIVLTALAILFPGNQLHYRWFKNLPRAGFEEGSEVAR